MWWDTYLAFAVKLEDSKLYFSALRHGIRSAYKSDDWKLVARLTKSRAADLRAFYKQHLESQSKEMASKMKTLTENLRGLQLVAERAKYFGGGWHDARTKYLEVLPFKGMDRSEEDKSFEAVDFLARAIYGEHVAFRIGGETLEDPPLGSHIRAHSAG